MPEPTFNLADLFEIVADAVPEKEAIVCGDRRLTYRELDERTTRLAHWLAANGVGRDDHVALYLYNGPEYLEAMVAAFKIRAVPINVNYRYVEEELRYLLTDSDARAVIAHRSLLPKLEAATPTGLATLVVDDGLPSPGGATRGWVEHETALASASATRDFGPRSSDDLYILYTGGTTGMPKGVMWRHEDIFFAAFGGGNPGGDPAVEPTDLAAWAPQGRARSLPASPFMHGTAHWMAFAALYAGGTVVVSADRRFDADRLWRLVADERVSFLTIVGDAFGRPLVDALRRLPPTVNVSCCRVVLSGGAVLSPSTKDALADLMPGALVVDSYGASETGGQGRSVTTAGARAKAGAFTVNDETAVLDDDFRPITLPGRVGRLARSGRIPLGYFGDAEKTAETFPTVAGKRWAVPGDYATVEEDGTIMLLGRGSVSINTGGEKVYPEEVESVLKGHETVFDVLVVGVPDERWGERVVAVIEPWAGAHPALAEIDAFARHSLAAYKVPRDLVLVDRIERAPSGKADYVWARRVAAARLGVGNLHA